MKNKPLSVSDVRAFGVVAAIASAAVAWWLRRRGLADTRALAIVAAGVSIALLGVVAPRILRPFAWLWRQLGHLLGLVTTPVVLTAIYFVVVVPVGLLLRLTGRDLLGLRRDPSASTHWHERDHAPAKRSEYLRLS